MKTALRAAFDSIGAAVEFDTLPAAFEIDVAQRDHRESYVLRYPLNDTIDAKALDVKPHLRHLVLDVTGYWLPISGRYLCGHDEFHWFVAQLPFHRRTATVSRCYGDVEAAGGATCPEAIGLQAWSPSPQDSSLCAARRMVLSAAAEDACRGVTVRTELSARAFWWQAASGRVAFPLGDEDFTFVAEKLLTRITPR